MFNGIEKKTYVNADEKTRWALTYDMLHEIKQKITDLERDKYKKNIYATFAGFVGGFTAMLTSWGIKKM